MNDPKIPNKAIPAGAAQFEETEKGKFERLRDVARYILSREMDSRDLAWFLSRGGLALELPYCFIEDKLVEGEGGETTQNTFLLKGIKT